MNLKTYWIILITILINNRCMSSNGFYVVDKESNEALIGVKLRSLNNSKLEVTSDLNGYIKLEDMNKVANESLEFQYVGFKSMVISLDDLLKLDSVQLEELQTEQSLGTTGILPYRITKFYIDSNTIKTTNLNNVERDIAIESLHRLANSFYKDDYGRLKVSFEVDTSGNILSFELLEFSFQPINQVAQLKLKLQNEVVKSNLQLGQDNKSITGRRKSDKIKYSLPLNSE